MGKGGSHGEGPGALGRPPGRWVGPSHRGGAVRAAPVKIGIFRGEGGRRALPGPSRAERTEGEGEGEGEGVIGSGRMRPACRLSPSVPALAKTPNERLRPGPERPYEVA